MNCLLLITAVLFLATAAASAASATSSTAATTTAPAPNGFAETHKPRLLVLTDISNEPDDEESLVRLLVYANEFDIEGFVATTSTWLKEKTREDLIRRTIDAYDQVQPNLAKHAEGFPTAEQLRGVTCTGQPGYGMKVVAAGSMSTPGSKRVIDAVDRADDRPIWISVWGGANTLAQALADVRATRSPEQVERFVEKIRVYSISDQDDAGPWIRREFPKLFYIVTPSMPDGREYYRATWTGISGDRHYKNGPFVDFELVDNPWLEEHVMKNHGPLGALYPRVAYIMEGDTPAYLGLVDNGLGWPTSPAYGGWGGRYALNGFGGDPRRIWTNNDDARDTVTTPDGKSHTSEQATVWRWRKHFQHDFAARMDWCIADSREKANHNPIAVLNGDRTKRVLKLSAPGGSSIPLSAEGTNDPDGKPVKLTWWIYNEAGSFKKGDMPTLSSPDGTTTELRLPQVKRSGSVHVILQVEDEGTPSLFAYRRTVVEVTP